MNPEEVRPIPPPPTSTKEGVQGNPALGKALDDLNEALQLRIDGRFMPVELTGLSLTQILYPTLQRKQSEKKESDVPATNKKKGRGASEKSFRDVNPTGHISPNLAYTIKQAAEFLQLSEDTVLKMCTARRWKCSQHENAYRIKGSVILDYLEGK
jgi:hypothetical protein